jgi:hypothetical protein
MQDFLPKTRVRDGLAAILMPWRYSDPLRKVSGTLSLALMVMAVAMFFLPDELFWPGIVAAGVLGVLACIITVMDLRAVNRLTRETASAMQVDRYLAGVIPLDDLNPEQQEEAHVLRAQLRLKEEK